MHYSIVFLMSAMTVLAAPSRPQDISAGYARLERRAFPGPKATRAAKTITGTLGQVKQGVDTLDAAVLKVSSGPDAVTALADVASKGTTLGDMLKAAQARIQAVDETDLGGAVEIQDSATSLGKSLDKLSSDLITIEPIVRKAGLDGAVVGILKQQQTSSGGLVDSVASKLPKLARNIAKDQTAGVTKSLTRVIDTYEKGAAAPKPSPN